MADQSETQPPVTTHPARPTGDMLAERLARVHSATTAPAAGATAAVSARVRRAQAMARPVGREEHWRGRLQSYAATGTAARARVVTAHLRSERPLGPSVSATAVPEVAYYARSSRRQRRELNRARIVVVGGLLLVGVGLSVAVCKASHSSAHAAMAPRGPANDGVSTVARNPDSVAMPVESAATQSANAATVRRLLADRLTAPSGPAASANVGFGTSPASRSPMGGADSIVGGARDGGWSRAETASHATVTGWGSSVPPSPYVDYDAGWTAPVGAVAIWPASGPITSAYGPFHPLGIDIGVDTGTPIHAMAAGRVTFSGGDPCCSYGYYLDIDHGNGIATRYGHMVVPSALRAGDYVRMGSVIGLSGSTGFSTGPHVHFEVRWLGRPVNPTLVLP